MSELIFSVRSALRTLFLDLCSIVYKLIVVCYNVFERIGTANILQGSDIFQQIANRIGLILGLFMVFRITFLFIQYIINPDDMTDKSKGIGNIVKRVLISVVLLGSVSEMFNLAFKFQNLLIEDNVIPNIIFNESEYDTENFGSRLSSMLFFSFFRYEEDEENEMSNVEMNRAAQDCIKLEEAMKIDVENNNNYELVFSCVDAKAEYTNHATGETEEKFVYTFDGGGLLALAVGLFTLYSIFIFTIQVGVRLIQLAYLQLISPVPIMMYIAPKGEEKLKKWGSQCLTTFLDYFLRSAIIYFVVFLINILMNSRDSGIDEIWTGNTGTDAYILIILIIALFTFARKVPNLLKEIFPSLGGAASFDYGLRMSNEAQRTLRAGAGFATGAVVGFLGNGIGRAVASYRENGRIGDAIGNGLMGSVRGTLGGAGRGLIGGVRNQHLNQIYNDRTNRNRQNITDTLNNSDVMRNHARNENVMNARNAIMDEAERRLLSATGGQRNDALRIEREALEALRNQEVPYGFEADHAREVAEAETRYRENLERESNLWINSHGRNNEVVRRNVSIINNNSGANINVNDNSQDIADLINTARTESSDYNALHAQEIVNNEQTLEDMNRQHGGGH